jgi:hypothetical protein
MSGASSQALIEKPIRDPRERRHWASELESIHPADRQPYRILTDNGYRFRTNEFTPSRIVLSRQPGLRGGTGARRVYEQRFFDSYWRICRGAVSGRTGQRGGQRGSVGRHRRDTRRKLREGKNRSGEFVGRPARLPALASGRLLLLRLTTRSGKRGGLRSLGLRAGDDHGAQSSFD